MSCFRGSLDTPEKEISLSNSGIFEGSGKQISNQIDVIIAREAKTLKDNPADEILVLGSASSGKTTFIKQMKLIHGQGFSEKELQMYRRVIFCNLCEGLIAILQKWPQIKWRFSSEMETAIESKINTIQIEWKNMRKSSNGEQEQIPELFSEVLKGFAKEGQLKRILIDERVDMDCTDAFVYFFTEKIDQVLTQDWMPDVDDILHARTITQSISVHQFKINGDNTLRFIDVSGQKSKRLKWLPLFSQVTTVMYFVPLGNYNQNLVEDRQMNILKDSIALFDVLINHIALKSVSFMLILNKIDLFRAKLPLYPLQSYLVDYNGENNEKDALKHIKYTFLKLVPQADKLKKVFVTHGTDRKTMKLVIGTIVAVMTVRNLTDTGLLQ